MNYTAKYLSVALALLVLVGSLGIPLSKMTCLSSGKVQWGWFDAGSCCPNDFGSESKAASECCDFDYITVLLEFESFSSDSEVDEITQVAFLWVQHVSTELTTATVENIYHYTDLPPPSGRDLLSLIAVLRL